MTMMESFIVTFIEEVCIFILWSKISLRNKDILLENLFIILIGALITSITGFNVYFNMGISYLTIIFLVCIVYKKKIIRTIVEFFAILAFIMIMQLICIFIYNKYIGNYQGEFLISVFMQLIILILSLVIYYFIPILKKYFIYDINAKVIFYFIMNFLSYVLILKIIWNYDMNLVLNNIPELIVTIITMFSINILLYFYIIKVEQEKRESKVQSKYSELLRNITQELRARQHDFKNHLNVMNGLIENTNGSELKEYIDSLNNSMTVMEDIIYIENPIVRAIIYSKISEANSENIKFLYSVNNSFTNINVKDYELAEILSNLIDNAFEAVESQEGEKLVSIKIYLEGESSIVKIINSGITLKSDNIKRIFERGFSTKQGNNRGYGLYNTKKIVERTGGKIQLSLEDNITIFKLFIK
ncbi:sensor histidine kinase [Clostridium tagluense]|uniref:sensor histidine kinase n=1 Tax=Clostridium tagluense TaxID=360422 RepID=UPI001C6EB217|nr:ATP-binding protein [Clostridium tagluense]MBW9159129.1 GHKL domain-containing protein [Clostridium tagluense]WLC68221.1 GHKL domain-containing protein [Clostridium tagluense]